MNALQELIASYLRDHPGEDYASIGRRGGLSRQTVRDNATKETRRQTPHPDTIAGLARGMNLPVEMVKAAAREAAGYQSLRPDEINTPEAVLMWEAYGLLDDERRAELEARARHLLAEQQELRARRGRNGKSRK